MITTNNLKLPEEKNEGKKLRTLTTNRIRDEVKDTTIGPLRGPTLLKGKIIQAGSPVFPAIPARMKTSASAGEVIVEKKAMVIQTDTHGEDRTIKVEDHVPDPIPEPFKDEDLTASPKAAEPYIAEDPPAPAVEKAKKKPGPKAGTKRTKKT